MRFDCLSAAAIFALSLNGAAVAAPAIDDADKGFVVGFMSSSTSSCVKEVHAKAPIPVAACACVAALIASRFTRDELIESRGDQDAMTQMHPELPTLLATCAATAQKVEAE